VTGGTRRSPRPLRVYVMKPGRMHRAIDALSHGLRVASTAMLIAIVAINAANVFGRYLLGTSFVWGEEVMLFLMIGAVFILFPAVTWDARHIRMDFLAQSLPAGAWRSALDAFADIVSFAVSAVLACVSMPIVLRLVEFDQRSLAAEIPMALPQGVLPLGFALAALALIARRFTRPPAADRAIDEPQ